MAACVCHMWQCCSAMCFFNLAKPFSAIQRIFFRVFGLLAEHVFGCFRFVFLFYFACACFFSESLVLTWQCGILIVSCAWQVFVSFVAVSCVVFCVWRACVSDLALRRLPFDECWIAMHFDMAKLRFAVDVWVARVSRAPLCKGSIEKY